MRAGRSTPASNRPACRVLARLLCGFACLAVVVELLLWRDLGGLRASGSSSSVELRIPGNADEGNKGPHVSSGKVLAAPEDREFDVTTSTARKVTPSSEERVAPKIRYTVLMISNVLPLHLDSVPARGPDAANGWQYITLTIVLNYLYAMQHGAYFLFVHVEQCKHSFFGERDWWWCRILEIKRTLDDFPDSEWVLYVDADAVINGEASLEQLVQAAENSPRQNGPVDLSRWIQSSSGFGQPDPHVILSKAVNDLPGVCMGMQAWRNSPQARTILGQLWESPIDTFVWKHPENGTIVREKKLQFLGNYGEQGAINSILFDIFGTNSSAAAGSSVPEGSPYTEKAREGLKRTVLDRALWRSSIAIVPASWLSFGTLVNHADLGHQPESCGNTGPIKLKNCILPWWTAAAPQVTTQTIRNLRETFRVFPRS